MNIAPAVLLDQYQRARKLWPFLADVGKAHGLPAYLLFALGSRETNLAAKYTTGARGDGGHGHGLFQLDDRWHTIPSGFDTDPRGQAEKAGSMLGALIKDKRWSNDWISAVNAYNSGQGLTEHTTGGDYGPDVLTRRWYLLRHARST